MRNFFVGVGHLCVSGYHAAWNGIKNTGKRVMSFFGFSTGTNAGTGAGIGTAVGASLLSEEAKAQSLSGTDYTAGTTAMETVATQIAAYVPYVVNLCYAIAGVVAIVGAISVYIAMNNEEQDVKKKIMMIVGACIFLIAAAQALPLFFGISG